MQVYSRTASAWTGWVEARFWKSGRVRSVVLAQIVNNAHRATIKCRMLGKECQDFQCRALIYAEYHWALGLFLFSGEISITTIIFCKQSCDLCDKSSLFLGMFDVIKTWLHYACLRTTPILNNPEINAKSLLIHTCTVTGFLTAALKPCPVEKGNRNKFHTLLRYRY